MGQPYVNMWEETTKPSYKDAPTKHWAGHKHKQACFYQQWVCEYYDYIFKYIHDPKVMYINTRPKYYK